MGVGPLELTMHGLAAALMSICIRSGQELRGERDRGHAQQHRERLGKSCPPSSRIAHQPGHGAVVPLSAAPTTGEGRLALTRHRPDSKVM